MIAPEADAEFVACLEEVLDVYAQPYDPSRPVLCMDEQPVQLQRGVRPLAGWRDVSVRHRRTKVDRAQEIAQLLEGRYAHCERVVLVCDPLNIHTKGAFYDVFEPERARQLVRRIQFCYTPKHGSWLNIAENELSSLTRQCISDERFGDIETLCEATTAWSCDVNNIQRGVDWQMKIDDARCKLTSIYPKTKF